MNTTYRCLSCGGEIVETESFNFAMPATSVAKLEHIGPADVACQWFFEALADEMQRVREAVVRRVVEDIFGRPKR